jgi:hypothetical protein
MTVCVLLKSDSHFLFNDRKSKRWFATKLLVSDKQSTKCHKFNVSPTRLLVTWQNPTKKKKKKKFNYRQFGSCLCIRLRKNANIREH